MQDTPTKLWSGQFVLALVLQMGLAISFFLYYSTIGIYATKLTSVEVYIGIVTGIYAFASLSTRFFSGRMMKYSSCKKVLQFGMVLLMAASAGYFFTKTLSILIFVRALHGLGYGLASAALATMISSMLPKERLLEGLGYAMMMNTLCVALGPVIALNLTQSNPDNFLPVFVVALLVAVVLAVVSLFMKERVIPQQTKADRADGKPLQALRYISLATIFVCCILFIMTLVHTSVNACLNLYALEQQFGNLSLFFILFSTANFLTRLFMNRIYRVFTERQVLIGITVMLIVVFFGIGLAPHRFWIISLGIPLGIVMGLYYPLASAKMLKSMPESEQTTANNISLALQDIAATMGAVLWTGLAGVLSGYRMVYLLCAVFSTVLLAIILIYPSVLKRYQVEEDVWQAQ